MFLKMRPVDRAKRELLVAEEALLETEAALEHYTAMKQMYEARIARLAQFIHDREGGSER